MRCETTNTIVPDHLRPTDRFATELRVPGGSLKDGEIEALEDYPAEKLGSGYERPSPGMKRRGTHSLLAAIVIAQKAKQHAKSNAPTHCPEAELNTMPPGGVQREWVVLWPLFAAGLQLLDACITWDGAGYALKRAPIFLPKIMPAAIMVRPRKTMAQTPSAAARLGPVPRAPMRE
jgi:hypothetical protein